MFFLCLQIQERYGHSVDDSLVIAAALGAGCDRILTEDLQRDQRIESLVIENLVPGVACAPSIVTHPQLAPDEGAYPWPSGKAVRGRGRYGCVEGDRLP